MPCSRAVFTGASAHYTIYRDEMIMAIGDDDGGDDSDNDGCFTKHV